jgi:hypothetical protein
MQRGEGPGEGAGEVAILGEGVCMEELLPNLGRGGVAEWEKEEGEDEEDEEEGGGERGRGGGGKR